MSVPPPFRGRARPLDSLRAGGITNFYWQYFQTPGIAEAEFERDFGLTMKTLLGRGFSQGPSYLFVEAGKGFLGDVKPDRPLPAWLSEADLGFSPRPTKNRASVAGSTGTATSTATGN